MSFNLPKSQKLLIWWFLLESFNMLILEIINRWRSCHQCRHHLLEQFQCMNIHTPVIATYFLSVVSLGTIDVLVLVLQKIFVRQLIIACRFSHHELKVYCLAIQLARKLLSHQISNWCWHSCFFVDFPPPSDGGEILMHEK